MMVLLLSDPAACDVRRAGGKAARLASLAAKGFHIPDGVVVTTEAFAAVAARLNAHATPERVALEPLPPEADEALRRAVRPGGALHGARVAVRSSAAAEDMAGASFAGQYETFLDVRTEDDVVASVQRCFASAYAARVGAYKAAHGDLPAGMAVLVQRFVDADAAGVAFTAHPVTGERDVVVVSAVRGVGETLVSGQSSAEEWEVRGDRATRRRSVAPVIEPATAAAVAELARRIETDAGAPQDIEWAARNGEIFLLQARPMTAVPDPVTWRAPLPGGWIRNFRLGEWLGDPVTPLFESWFLARLEARFAATMVDVFGVTIPEPQHVVVNGWYFYGLAAPSGADMLRHLPRIIWRVSRHFRQAAALFPPTAHLGYDSERRRWTDHLLPEYERAVADADGAIGTADIPALMDLVDGLADRVGDQFASILGVAGFAAKAEAPLLTFWRTHLSRVDGSFLHLVRGIEDAHVGGHAVQGLDWYLPTLGETDQKSAGPDAAARMRMAAERDAVESRARAALAGQPKRLRSFERLVATARRAHVMRQRQTGAFTLAWPVLRRAVHRLGTLLAGHGLLASPDDLFFLRHEELAAARSHSNGFPDARELAQRRDTWTRQRRLTPPLLLGELTGVYKDQIGQIDRLLHGAGKPADNEIRGNPGSPGVVTGRARVLLRLEELDRLQPGEILVAPVTTPGWTPAFARAAAIVTDTGSIASHASIVAREYGIPAVVATENATARLCDGQMITVDGSRGVVLVGV